MAITILSSPQHQSPGYNPMYLYASSTNVALDNFRYIVTITNTSTSTELATLRILPRESDDYLELNMAKILQGDLSSFADDIDLNNVVTGFNNSESSGFTYEIEVGEEYTYEWDFADFTLEIIDAQSKLRLVGLLAHTYIVGDQVSVDGAAEPFAFSDNNIVFSSNVSFVTPGHTIAIGDTVYIDQDPGYTYEAYNGFHTVVNTTATLVEIDVPIQGISPTNPGTLWRNFPYDGLQTVIGIGTVASGPYTGYFYIDLGQTYIDGAPAPVAGTTRYYNGTLFSDPALQTISSVHVFNGADSTKNWLNWDQSEYNPFGTDRNFLTNLPDNWRVTLEDDVFLNFWGAALPNGVFKAFVNTYDSSDVLIGEYEYFNPNLSGTQTDIQNVSMGPRWLNSAAELVSPQEIIVISGPTTPIFCGVSYYTVNVVFSNLSEQTEFRTFYVNCPCVGKFTNYPILFMDRFGSFVPIDFYLEARERISIKRDNYNKFIGDYVPGSTNGFNYSLADHSNVPYNVELTEKWTINTDWLDDSEILFFEQLVTSPLVYILIDNVYRAVNITDTLADRTRRSTKKNIKKRINIEFSQNDNVNV